MKTTTVLRFRAEIDDDAPLIAAAEQCRLARNAGLENWLLRQRGMPESEKQGKISPRPDKDGNPRALSESTKLYHAMTAVADSVNTNVISALAAEVNTALGTKVDWRKQGEGKTRKRANAILDYEDRPPFYTSLQIPILRSQSAVIIEEGAARVEAKVIKGEVLTLPLSVRGMTAGQLAILQSLASGERRQPDSKLMYKSQKNAWYLHVPIQFETERRSDIEVEVYPVLGRPEGRANDNFLRVHLPDGKRWTVGHGAYLLAQTARLIGLRKQIGWRYARGEGAGHGRQKIDAAVRKRRKQQQDIVKEVCNRAVTDVLRQCDRCGAGVIVYRRPSLPLRTRSWFAAVGLDWDWTSFESRLKNVAARRGVELVVKHYRIAEAKEMGYVSAKETPAGVTV